MGNNSIGAVTAGGRPATDLEEALSRLGEAQHRNADFANNLACRANALLETILQDGAKAADSPVPTRAVAAVEAPPRTALLREIAGATDREDIIARRLQDIENVLDRVVL